jgi:hypothetical protein
LVGVLACVSAVVPVSYAQERAASLSIVTHQEDGHQFFEITGVGFPVESKIPVRAINRRTREGVSMYAISDATGAFRGAFVGKDADGHYSRVAPGTWVVRAKLGEVAAKTTFKVAGGSGLKDGRYGSREALLTIEGSHAEFLFPCSRGFSLEAIVPDENGDFEVSATLIEERGPRLEQRAARMFGNVDGDVVTFTVTAEAAGRLPAAVYGPASVTYGREPIFERCV